MPGHSQSLKKRKKRIHFLSEQTKQTETYNSKTKLEFKSEIVWFMTFALKLNKTRSSEDTIQ